MEEQTGIIKGKSIVYQELGLQPRPKPLKRDRAGCKPAPAKKIRYNRLGEKTD